MSEEKPAGSQSLFRGLTLIEILSNFPNGCALSKLSELSKLNKSTVHRLLQGLQSCGYVAACEKVGSYRLTSKFVAIGHKNLMSQNIISIAAPHLDLLNYETGETVNFSTCDIDHAVMIYKLEPTMGMLRTRAYIGQQLHLHCSAMGKIFMAYGSKDYPAKYWKAKKDIIKPLTDNTIVKLKDMHEELKRIKETGIAYDNEENEVGVTCVALPVFDFQGRVTYSISISLSTQRFKTIGEEGLLKPLSQAAIAISRDLGYAGDFSFTKHLQHYCQESNAKYEITNEVSQEVNSKSQEMANGCTSKKNNADVDSRPNLSAGKNSNTKESALKRSRKRSTSRSLSKLSDRSAAKSKKASVQ